MKGLPAFVMNQVMKRHPLALRYIRQQFFQPEVFSRDCDAQSGADSSSSSPPRAFSRWSSTNYEESVPVGQFLRNREESTLARHRSSDPTFDREGDDPIP